MNKKKTRSSTLREDIPTKPSLPRNVDEPPATAATTTSTRSDNEGRDARRYAGVGNDGGRNRPPAEESTVPHHRSEINEEVKATLTGADKRRRRRQRHHGTMPDSSGNSKSRAITGK